MKLGDMSRILRGPNERFWLVLLVDVRENEKADFDAMKEAILADMRGDRRATLARGHRGRSCGPGEIEILAP